MNKLGIGAAVEAFSFAERNPRHPLSRAIHDAAEDVQARIRDGLTEALSPHAHDDGVRLGAGVWLVTARK